MRGELATHSHKSLYLRVFFGSAGEYLCGLVKKPLKTPNVTACHAWCTYNLDAPKGSPASRAVIRSSVVRPSGYSPRVSAPASTRIRESNTGA